MINTLEFDSLYLEFGQHRVLSNIFMTCKTNEVVGLLGRNGSGKSCLMRIVFGSLPSSHKSIRINRKHFAGNSKDSIMINYLPQEKFIPPFLSLREILRIYGISHSRLTSYFPEFQELMKQQPNELSGVYRRIAELLIILLFPSKFSLLDEPFSGLMPIHVEKLKEIIVIEKKNKGIIITDHLYSHITEIANKIYLLSSGQTYPITRQEQLIQRGYISNTY